MLPVALLITARSASWIDPSGSDGVRSASSGSSECCARRTRAPLPSLHRNPYLNHVRLRAGLARGRGTPSRAPSARGRTLPACSQYTRARALRRQASPSQCSRPAEGPHTHPRMTIERLFVSVRTTFGSQLNGPSAPPPTAQPADWQPDASLALTRARNNQRCTAACGVLHAA